MTETENTVGKSTDLSQSENTIHLFYNKEEEFIKSNDVCSKNVPLLQALHDKLITNTKDETVINEPPLSNNSVSCKSLSPRRSDSFLHSIFGRKSKKLDEVAADASDMESHAFEQPNIIEQFLSTLDCVCGAPKLTDKTIYDEDPSKESSITVDLPVVLDPMVTEVVPSSGELNMPSKESTAADLPAIRDPIVAEVAPIWGESNLTENLNSVIESLNSIMTDSTADAFSSEKIKEERLDEAAKMANKALDEKQNDAFSAEKIKEQRLDEAAKMAKMALDEKENVNTRKAKFSFRLSSKLVTVGIGTLNQRTNEMKSVAGHYMRAKKHVLKTKKETVELTNSQSLNEPQTSSSFEGENFKAEKATLSHDGAMNK